MYHCAHQPRDPAHVLSFTSFFLHSFSKTSIDHVPHRYTILFYFSYKIDPPLYYHVSFSPRITYVSFLSLNKASRSLPFVQCSMTNSSTPSSFIPDAVRAKGLVLLLSRPQLSLLRLCHHCDFSYSPRQFLVFRAHLARLPLALHRVIPAFRPFPPLASSHPSSCPLHHPSSRA
jgi:hypothetical protein